MNLYFFSIVKKIHQVLLLFLKFVQLLLLDSIKNADAFTLMAFSFELSFFRPDFSACTRSGESHKLNSVHSLRSGFIALCDKGAKILFFG